jgi:two-component system alkaline phosphatase synthesis response regulator PhoP
MKILIVEDEETLSNVMKAELKDIGHEIKVAKNGEDALILARSFNPRMILLDLVLPKKGGLEVLTDLKSDEELKNISVIILSNLAEDESIKKALSLGAEDYFVKAQHSIYEVLEMVKKHMPKAD